MRKTLFVAVAFVTSIGGGVVAAADSPIQIVVATAAWCPPCRTAKQHTLPQLKKLGYEFKEADADKIDVTLWDVKDLPTFLIHRDGVEIGRVIGQQPAGVDGRNATLAEIVAIVNRAAPKPIAGESPATGLQRQPARDGKLNPVPFDLVAMLRSKLGVKPVSHSSIAWQFDEPAEVTLGEGVTITRPKTLAAEFDFKADGSLEIVFADPLVAHGSKAGVPGDAEISKLVIRGNVVSAPGVPVRVLGIDLFHKDWSIEIKQNPFE